MSRARDLYDRIRSGGLEAINDLIADRTAEEMFLDFKRSADQGEGERLADSDNSNLSKAISGFGNGAGGVIVWGIDCSPHKGADVAQDRSPLVDAQAFRSRLESAVSRLTIPPHGEVENSVIEEEDGKSGHVVTLIPPAARAPLRAEAGKLHNYYIRAGSSFHIVPHDALAGLFGRAPAPRLALIFKPHMVRRPQHQADDRMVLAFSLGIENVGSVLASRAFVSLRWDDCKASFQPRATHKFESSFPLRTLSDRGAQAVATADTVLPPDGLAEVLDCAFVIPENPREDLSIRVTVGAHHAAPRTVWLVAPTGKLRTALARTRAQESFPADEVLEMRHASIET